MNEWQSISTAPKDTPILGWCVHEADTYTDPNDYHRLTDYAANCEGLGHVENGPHVLVWSPDYWENTDEYGSGFTIPGWWTRFGSDGEEFAFPTHWQPITPPKL